MGDQYQVSIPTAMGRGWAPTWSSTTARTGRSSIKFQSPRRWGGVGLANPPEDVINHAVFQSPRRWGGVGLWMLNDYLGSERVMFQSPLRWGGVGLARHGSCSL